MPFDTFNDLAHDLPVWRLVAFAICVLVFRRLPWVTLLVRILLSCLQCFELTVMIALGSSGIAQLEAWSLCWMVCSACVPQERRTESLGIIGSGQWEVSRWCLISGHFPSKLNAGYSVRYILCFRERIDLSYSCARSLQICLQYVLEHLPESRHRVHDMIEPIVFFVRVHDVSAQQSSP